MNNVQLYQQIYIKMLPTASDMFDLDKFIKLVNETYCKCLDKCTQINKEMVDSQNEDEEKHNQIINNDDREVKLAPIPLFGIFTRLSEDLIWPTTKREMFDAIYNIFHIASRNKRYDLINKAIDLGYIKKHSKEGKATYWDNLLTSKKIEFDFDPLD